MNQIEWVLILNGILKYLYNLNDIQSLNRIYEQFIHKKNNVKAENIILKKLSDCLIEKIKVNYKVVSFLQDCLFEYILCKPIQIKMEHENFYEIIQLYYPLLSFGHLAMLIHRLKPIFKLSLEDNKRKLLDPKIVKFYQQPASLFLKFFTIISVLLKCRVDARQILHEELIELIGILEVEDFYLEIDGDIVDDIMYVTPRIEHKSQVATIEDPRRKYIPFNSLETENLVVDDYVIGYFAANPKWDYWARGQLNEVFSSPQPYRLSDNKVKKLHNGNYDGDVEYVATVEKDNKSQEPDYLSVEFGIINGRKLIVSFSVNGTTSKITNRGNWPRIISTVVEIIRNEMPKIIRQYSLSVVVFSSSDTYLGMFTPRKYSRSKLYTKRAIPFMTQVLNSNFPGQWQHEGVTSRDYESFYIWTKIQDQD